MKKFRILLIVVLCLIFCSFNGFSSQRYNWWNNRLKMLNVQKNDIIKDNKEWGQVIGLINNDIERAKKILILIDKKSGEKDPTKYMNRKYTNAKIGELVNNILYPLFSLYYYEYLLKELGNRETYEHAKDVVHNYLQTSSKELWESIDEDKINQIIYENINKTDWKFLSIEIFLGEIIMSKDNIFKKVKSDIEKNVDKELAQRDYIISQVELRDKVITCFNEYIKKINIKNELCNSQEAFLASWSWNGISKGVLNKFRYYMEIINMYQKYSEISVNAVDPFYDNPEKLEQQLFKSIRKAHLDLRSLKKVDTVNEKKNVNQYILKIPEDPDIIQLFNDMDSIRLNALSRITGQEKGNFFEELDTKIDITIDKHLNSTKEEFKQEDKKLIAEIEKMVLGIVHKAYSIAQKKTKNSKLDANKHKLVILNENEYKEAKSIFKDKISHVNQYKQESIKFIRCISGAKKTSKDKILEANRSYGNRNHYYLNFVLSQIRKIAEIDNQRQPIHKRFVTVVRSTNNLLNAIGYSIRLDKTVLLQLNDEEYEKVKNIRMQVASELKNTRSEIKKIYSDMVRNKEKARIRLSSAEIQMKDRIAKLEVEYIHEKILESRKLYKEQNYSNSAFKKYFDTYNELIKKAQSGKMSTLMDEAIKKQSLIGLNNSINIDRIRSQYEIKKYIRADIKKDIARLVILIRSCKRSKIKLNTINKILEDLKLIKHELHSTTDITVGRWKINESNFLDVDRKVVKLLTIKRNKEFMKGTYTNNVNNSMQKIINLRKLGVKVIIPYGWTEDLDLDPTDLNKGIVKSFKSFDGNFHLYIARMDVEGKDAKEVSGRWIKIMKSRSIKGKWGKKEDINYFWTISNDKKKNIMEVYTVPRGKQAFILAGITDRDKYKYFKKKLNLIFQSIKTDIKLTSSSDNKEGLGALQGI